MEHGDSATALRILKPLADAGNTEAQEYMGELCFFFGLPKKAAETATDQGDSCAAAQAAQWFKLAAQKGNPKAQCNLGTVIWMESENGESDAFGWMLKSAEQGYPDCMCDVGRFYRNGWGGVDKNYTEALRWTKSAVHETNQCQYELGALYALGQGVNVDYKEATKLLQKAASAQYRVHQDDAALLLGTLYEEGGHGIEKDYAEAARWYKELIYSPKMSRRHDSTLSQALVNLGDLYIHGEGVPQDYSEARKLFTRAAEKGYAQAQVRVASLYEDGNGVRKDGAEAVRWYRLAADQGDAQAQLHMGLVYKHGEGVPQDYVLAHMWFNLAAASDRFPPGMSLAQSQRDTIAGEMTAEQVAEAQRLAREWTPKKPPARVKP